MDQTQDNHKKDPTIETYPLFFFNQSKKLTIHQKCTLLLTPIFILVFYRVAHTVQDRLYDDSISDSLQFITFPFSSASHPLIFSVLHPNEKQQNQHWLCNWILTSNEQNVVSDCY